MTAASRYVSSALKHARPNNVTQEATLRRVTVLRSVIAAAKAASENALGSPASFRHPTGTASILVGRKQVSGQWSFSDERHRHSQCGGIAPDRVLRSQSRDSTLAVTDASRYAGSNGTSESRPVIGLEADGI